jgi:excinuclease ABC subunit A
LQFHSFEAPTIVKPAPTMATITSRLQDAPVAPNFIELRGVRVHNLKGVDVDIPLRGLTVISGVSGAGKTSLAFDTLYAEAQRRYLQSFSTHTRQFLERLDKPEADTIGNVPPALAVARQSAPRGPRATVGTLTEVVDYLRLLFARAGTLVCLRCGQEVRAAQLGDIVAAVTALPTGTRFSVGFPSKPESDVHDWVAGLKEEGFVRVQIGNDVFRLGEQDLPLPGSPQRQHGPNIWVLVDRLEAGKNVERLHDAVDTALTRGNDRMAILLDGRDMVFDRRPICPRCDIPYPVLEPRLFSFNDPLGACPACGGTGVVAAHKRGRTAEAAETCSTCHGSRLNDQTRLARLAGQTIAELSARSGNDLADFLARLDVSRSHDAGRLLVDQLRKRLACLTEVELGYLTLDRAAHTLSSAEAQRIRLATALASNLVRALYIFDEPTAGLHSRDTGKLLEVLRRLRDAGNTLVLVEHDLEVIAAADQVIDLGPGAGEEGGEVLYQGPPDELARCAASITGGYLSGQRFIGVPSRRRKAEHGSLHLRNATTHNLKNLTVDFPLGILCVVTGVSGAGKSSLVEHTLYPALCRRLHKKCGATTAAEIHGAGSISDVVLMEQRPIVSSLRSNPATYLKVFDDIRGVFADTSEARIRNFGPAAFSFNQPGGRCDTCEGQGTLTVDMQFLPDVAVICPDCHGARFKPEVLEVKVRNRSIAEVLDLTAREAFRFFRGQSAVERRLKWLLDVGLDYLRLGQPLDTLSGGERQRLKLAGHLAASRKPRTLFLLLEPTTGLHPADVVRLLDCCQRLLDTGHSLILSEHNLDVVKCADHLIDLDDGRVVASGTPEEVALVGPSHTGEALRRILASRTP